MTGVNITSGEVYTNNPQGVRGIQSFEDFNKGFVWKNGKTSSGAPFRCLGTIKYSMFNQNWSRKRNYLYRELIK